LRVCVVLWCKAIAQLWDGVRATMGRCSRNYETARQAAANQRLRNYGTRPIVAAVHMERLEDKAASDSTE
jgi:hypothetical protein